MSLKGLFLLKEKSKHQTGEKDENMILILFSKARGKVSLLSVCGECSTELKGNQGRNNYDTSFKFYII